MTPEDPALSDRLATIVAAFDQYGEFLKRLADLIGVYDQALLKAGVTDPMARAALLQAVQTKFMGHRE